MVANLCRESVISIGDILRGVSNRGGVFLGSLGIRLDRHGHHHPPDKTIERRTITVSLIDTASHLPDKLPL